MRKFLSLLCAALVIFSTSPSAARNSAAAIPPNQQAVTTTPGQAVLEDGTPIKLRISQTVSSASAHVGDRVEFEVLEQVKAGQTVVIPKGGIAWGTVTVAQPKRRLGRAGKLEIVMDSVRLADGEKAALRATKEVKGGSHTAAMTVGIVATGLIIWPAAPFFLFMHGKDITIPKDTEVPTFINGDFPIELAKFQSAAVPVQSASNATPASSAQVTISSLPSAADIQVDGNFVGSTPSTIGLPAGKHTITVHRGGYKPWSRQIAVTSGTLSVVADLDAATQPAVKAQQYH